MREFDGVAAWDKLLPYFQGFLGQMTNWDAQQRTTCIMTCTSKVRFGYCLNQRGQIKYLRALQGHSGRVRLDPTLQNNVKIPYGWTDYINLGGSTWDYRSTVDAGLLAGGNGDNLGRHTCFLHSSQHFMRVRRRSLIWKWTPSKGSIQNEMEKELRRSLLVRSENCAT